MRDWPHVYLHADMDAFYVAVELVRRPELRGKPVVVATGTDPHARGVVMTASYEAREYGVHSALPLAVAHRRCPQAVLIPRDMELYKRASRKVMGILGEFSDTIEVVGLDEAYLDLSSSPAPKARARELKGRVRAETRLACSVGIGPNKLLAKIASDLEKPDGRCVLAPERMLEAVGERPATLLPGVGPRTAERLGEIGVVTVNDLAKADDSKLERAFGPRHGPALRSLANGHDERAVTSERAQKSESRETTFPHDISDRTELAETLDRLAEQVAAGMVEGGHVGRTVTLKIRLRPFRTHTRSRTLPDPTADAGVIRAVAGDLLERFELDAPVRLLGVGVAGLSEGAPRPAGASREGEPHAVGEPLVLDVG